MVRRRWQRRAMDGDGRGRRTCVLDCGRRYKYHRRYAHCASTKYPLRHALPPEHAASLLEHRPISCKDSKRSKQYSQCRRGPCTRYLPFTRRRDSQSVSLLARQRDRPQRHAPAGRPTKRPTRRPTRHPTRPHAPARCRLWHLHAHPSESSHGRTPMRQEVCPGWVDGVGRHARTSVHPTFTAQHTAAHHRITAVPAWGALQPSIHTQLTSDKPTRRALPEQSSTIHHSSTSPIHKHAVHCSREGCLLTRTHTHTRTHEHMNTQTHSPPDHALPSTAHDG